MTGKIVLAGVALFVAFTVAMNVLYTYGGGSSIRARARIRRLTDWYPLVLRMRDG